MKLLVMLALFLAPFSVMAADIPCTIHVDQNVPGTSLPGLTKISEPEARNFALQSINAPPGSYAEGELEVYEGCLVYSYDITVPNKQGMDEVIVDAGDGTILKHSHESQKQEQAEHTKGKAMKKSK